MPHIEITKQNLALIQHQLIPQLPPDVRSKLLHILANSRDGTEEDTLQACLRSIIQGTSNGTIVLSTAIFFTAYGGSVLMSSLLNTMKELDVVWKALAANLPFLIGSIATAPTGYSIENNGGRNAIGMQRLCATLLGGGGLIAMSSFTNLSTIDSFDYRYFGLLCAIAFTGLSFPSSLLLSNLLWWSPGKEARVISLFSGISGLAPGLNLIFLYYISSIGLRNIFILFSLILFAGTIATRWLVSAPYHQLKQLGLDHETAKTLAQAYGQVTFPLSTDSLTEYSKHMFQSLRDIRVITGILTGYLTFGLFAFATSNNYILLVHSLHFDVKDAVIFTGVSAVIGTIGRTLTGPIMIDLCDPSKGFYTLVIAMAIITALLTILATYRPSNGGARAVAVLPYCLGALQLAGGVAGIANARHLINQTKHPLFVPHSSGVIMTALNTFGTNAVFFLYVCQSPFLIQGPEGYANACILFAILSLLLIVVNVLIERSMRTPSSPSFFMPRRVLPPAPLSIIPTENPLESRPADTEERAPQLSI